MFEVASRAAWRITLLFALGLAPSLAPAQAFPSPAPWVTVVRIAIFASIAGGLGVLTRAAWRRYPTFARAALAALFGITALSFVLEAVHAPLASGRWIAVPLVWSVLVSAAAGPGARALFGGSPNRGARRMLGAGAAAAGAFSLLLSAPRFRTTSTASEQAGIAACHAPEEEAARLIDASRFVDAKTNLDASPKCAESARRLGLEAEIALGLGQKNEGAMLAERAVAADERDPHAAYAKASAAWGVGDVLNAEHFAKVALLSGRGKPAKLLIAELAVKLRRYAEGRTIVDELLAVEPDDPRSVYVSALLAKETNHYHDAREGFVRVLSLDPTMADARYELARLTYSSGATMEAQHHVDVFAASFPNDPRVAELRQMLTKPPPHKAMSIAGESGVSPAGK